MKYDAILQYQKANIELRKIYDEIEKSDVGVKLDRARTEFNNAKARVSESEKAAESLVALVNNAERLYGEAAALYQEIAAQIDGQSDEERAESMARLDNIRKKLTEIEKKLGEVKPRADKAIKEYLAGQETGKKMRGEYNKAKEALEALKKSKEEQVIALKKTMAELKSRIDADTFAQYEALRNEGKPVAFVEVVPEKNGTVFCRGCGIELSQKLKSELLDSGTCRCERCRRVLFVRQ